MVASIGRRAATTAGMVWIVALVITITAGGALAGQCGGSTTCACGDTVTSDYTMTTDLGPCPRLSGGVDTVGLTLRSGVTLDCAGHTISGPGDIQKNSFGVRVGDTVSNPPVTGVTITNCGVTKFWWGIYLQSAGDVLIDASHLYENGWKVPVENGSGYGIDIAGSQNVTLRGTRIADNGNEGLHLSASSGVTVDGNVFTNNGFEQVYLIHADGNVIQNNQATGGTQGLEMRFSSNNSFSYNVWAQSPAQVLENDDNDNIFYYDSFEGRVVVGDGSVNNTFRLPLFTNPSGPCLSVARSGAAYVYKGHFGPCLSDLVATGTATLDRSINNLAKVSRGVVVKFPGCTADMNLDAIVDDTDRQVVLAAMNSVIGGPNWNAEADLDHDGDVDADDLALFEAQVGPCGPNLMVTAVSNPPGTLVPGAKFSVTDTVVNQSAFAAGSSRTQYYVSTDTSRGSGDKLLIGGRTVPALGANATSTGTVTVTVPSSVVGGTYFLLACADDTELVGEATESDNCRASTMTVQIGRPDLVMTAVSDPPDSAPPGTSFSVTDTTRNQSEFPAAISRTQYFLSVDTKKGAGDKLLSGARSVPALAGDAESTGTVTVTIPANTQFGTYRLLACADEGNAVPESNETNNCLASAGTIQVGKPDLAVTAVSDPPATAVRGSSFSVTDTTRNLASFAAGASRTQYYLSLDDVRNAGDKLLSGNRDVGALAANGTSTGTVSVTIPPSTAAGSYFVIACADDKNAVAESDESNNCHASAAKVAVSQ